jgi:uncharacterized membrane protein YpjA
MRLVPESAQKRYETLLKEFEWTWTKAAIASLILFLLAIIFIGVIPSWWLYFAQRPPLNWTQNRFWLFKLRDLVAVILFTIPTVVFMVLPYLIQKQRRRLRGADVARPSGGYR